MLVTEKISIAEEIENLVVELGKDKSSLIPILQEIQKRYNFISDQAQQEIAKQLDIHPVEVYSVISFYAFLNSKPKGKNIVRLCKTISCDLQGKDQIISAIESKLGIKFGETTADKNITLEFANCIGMCDQGPALLVNDRVYSHVTQEKALQIINEIN